jgi:hypothetical protein
METLDGTSDSSCVDKAKVTSESCCRRRRYLCEEVVHEGNDRKQKTEEDRGTHLSCSALHSHSYSYRGCSAPPRTATSGRWSSPWTPREWWTVFWSSRSWKQELSPETRTLPCCPHHPSSGSSGRMTERSVAASSLVIPSWLWQNKDRNQKTLKGQFVPGDS